LEGEGGLGEAPRTPNREKQNIKKYSQARCFIWRQNNPEVKYFNTRIYGWGGVGVFLEEASRNKIQVAGACEFGNELWGSIK
jgi:hypothetical protein